jgi:hypothetical protein
MVVRSMMSAPRKGLRDFREDGTGDGILGNRCQDGRRAEAASRLCDQGGIVSQLHGIDGPGRKCHLRLVVDHDE